MGLTVYDFKSCDNLAIIGEKVAEDYYNLLENIKFVQNVREDKEYREEDIDLVCSLKSDEVLYVEVKTDSYTSGNMFYELISNDVTGEKGCMEKTQADLVFYYFINPSYRSAYIFDVKELRSWVCEHKNDFKLRRVYNRGYCSFGIAIPMDRLMSDLSKIERIDLNCIPDIERYEELGRKFWEKK